MAVFKKIVIWILTIESRFIIRKYKPFVVAVTGSVGKTSTKDAIFCVLQNHERYVRKSEKSLNSEIGLPLTIIGVPTAWRSLSGWIENIVTGFKMIVRKVDYPSCLVLEIGADHPGDIRKVAKWLPADIVVITKVSRTPVHIEFFKSYEEVLAEKASLIGALKDGGTLILYADDDNVVGLGEKVKGKNVKVLTYGIEKPATARAENYQSSIAHGISFDLDLVGEKRSVNVKNVLGKVCIYPLLAGATVGKSRNISLSDIVSSLNGFTAPIGRMNIIAGINGSMLIDDTYNSSPDAVHSALESLKDLKINVSSNALKEDFGLVNLSEIPIGKVSNRKIAILGDMMELGKFSGEEHRNVGKEVASVANILITVGPRSHATAEEAIRCGMPAEYVKSFDSVNDAIPYVTALVTAGDTVLIKGSQSVRMEKITKALLREPEKASKLIVRQEEEWLKRV